MSKGLIRKEGVDLRILYIFFASVFLLVYFIHAEGRWHSHGCALARRMQIDQLVVVLEHLHNRTWILFFVLIGL